MRAFWVSGLLSFLPLAAYGLIALSPAGAGEQSDLADYVLLHETRNAGNSLQVPPRANACREQASYISHSR